eukprot:m.131210 g.131210  ORF g.131210 m.131210 type:complete len:185 (-) comp15742_c6_seq2:622-1176(-)
MPVNFDQLETAYRDYVPELPFCTEDDVQLREIIEQHAQTARPNTEFKHLEQQARLVGNMRRCGLLDLDQHSTCFIEFGAGKAKLLHALRLAIGWDVPAAYLAVERQSGMKSKADKFHRARPSEGVKFDRVTIDIEHLDLAKAPLIDGTSHRIVAGSKHLCGCATGERGMWALSFFLPFSDLSLR